MCLRYRRRTGRRLPDGYVAVLTKVTQEQQKTISQLIEKWSLRKK
jgi:hypothetical protein